MVQSKIVAIISSSANPWEEIQISCEFSFKHFVGVIERDEFLHLEKFIHILTKIDSYLNCMDSSFLLYTCLYAHAHTLLYNRLA